MEGESKQALKASGTDEKDSELKYVLYADFENLAKRFDQLVERFIKVEDVETGHHTLVSLHDTDLNETRQYPRQIRISDMSVHLQVWLLRELKLQLVNADDLPAEYGDFANLPGDISSATMNWDPSKREDECSGQYMEYFKQVLMGINVAEQFRARDVKHDTSLLTVKTDRWAIRGTTDVIIYHGTYNRDLANAKIVCQLKKDTKISPHHLYQSFAELICGNAKAKEPAFAVLTDLGNVWEYMWLTRGVNDVAGVVHHARFKTKEEGLSALVRILHHTGETPCATMEHITARKLELETNAMAQSKYAASASDASVSKKRKSP